MKLVSMQMSKKEARGDFGPASPSKSGDDLPKYPYELRIRLDTDTLKKLGMKVTDYKAGDTCKIEAMCDVIGTSDSQRQGNKPRQEIELQICQLGVDDSTTGKKAKTRDKHLNDLAGGKSDY